MQPGVQLIDLNAGLAHEAAVDADLTELVLDQDDLLTLESFLNQLFDQRGFYRHPKSRRKCRSWSCFLP